LSPKLGEFVPDFDYRFGRGIENILYSAIAPVLRRWQA